MLKQVILTLLLTVAVFTFVLLLGNVLRDILSLLITRQATLQTVFKVILLLMPYVLAYALPIGMLTAALLVFGRFSADQELTAVRASGISLIAVVMPILVFSIGICGLSALFNCQIAPQCRRAAKQLIFNMGIANSEGFLTEGRFITEIPGITLYVQKKRGDYLTNIRLYELNKKNDTVKRIMAESGKVIWDSTNKQIYFELTNMNTETLSREFRGHNTNSNTIAHTNAVVETNTAASTNENIAADPKGGVEWVNTTIGSSTTDPIDLASLVQNSRAPKLSEMTSSELVREIRQLRAKGILPTPAEVQLNRQLAFSFAPFAFTLIGIPLAIRAHRREASTGVAFALGLLVIYYSFFVLAEALQRHDEIAPYLIFWVPNLLFQGLGGALLWRANRGG
ncbi:MAG: putative permease [Verrucomicrobiales bacterium]|nr:putative permease [Verrucomicrobiales bacterium]